MQKFIAELKTKTSTELFDFIISDLEILVGEDCEPVILDAFYSDELCRDEVVVSIFDKYHYHYKEYDDGFMCVNPVYVGFTKIIDVIEEG